MKASDRVRIYRNLVNRLQNEANPAHGRFVPVFVREFVAQVPINCVLDQSNAGNPFNKIFDESLIVSDSLSLEVDKWLKDTVSITDSPAITTERFPVDSMAVSDTVTTGLSPFITSLNFDLADSKGAGGAPIIVTGVRLTGATAATVGGVAGTITGNTPTTVTFTMPARSEGIFNVIITTPDGVSNGLPLEVWSPASYISGINTGGVGNANCGYYLDSRLGVHTSGSTITSWDASNTPHSFGSVSPSASPQLTANVFGNNVPGVTLNAANGFVYGSIDASAGLTMWWVVKYNSSDNTAPIGFVPLAMVDDDNSSPGSVAFGFSAGTTAFAKHTSTFVTVGTGGFNDNVAHMGFMDFGSSLVHSRNLDGSTSSNAIIMSGIESVNTIGIGSGGGFVGNIGAIIVCPSHAFLGLDTNKLVKWSKQVFGAV